MYVIFSISKDIDECADDLLNDCPLETTRCVNTYGDYNCECQQGYQNNGSSCEGKFERNQYAKR